ncbi:sigma-70 family RNA polymerase sigma factor [Bacillus arachidis]|uniref:sigma-70 family RNA polymerase sigma factor n=1 Tax=Bacillus arachidis TaxID=2819290 RepID=UPI00255C33FB|nr:sigma-70 family RNA polymerase sigma factor [Bacillus arachidis]WIY58992.1 sigma-70 family RNA polymerase sigma factor [Bacillus arachidis]
MREKQIEDYLKKHRKRMNEPIVRNFLEKDENFNLFKNAIINPTLTNKKLLDQSFKAHYKQVKVFNYVSKLIHYYSIDFDKKVNLNKQRNLLNLDITVEDNGGNQASIHDVLTSSDEDETYNNVIQEEKYLKNHLSDEVLLSEFNKLSKKQIKILNLFYLKEYTNREIAQMLGESEQTISYNHKSAIKKLKQAMKLELE